MPSFNNAAQVTVSELLSLAICPRIRCRRAGRRLRNACCSLCRGPVPKLAVKLVDKVEVFIAVSAEFPKFGRKKEHRKKLCS